MEIQAYEKILNDNNIERHKCKCCGKDIIYDNTIAHINRFGRLNIKGKSYLTTKIVENISYPLQVCQECLVKHFPEIKLPVSSFCAMCESTKFAFDIPEDVYLKARQKYAMTQKHMIEKYGEEEGKKMWDRYCKRQSETNTYEYKKEKYGWTEDQFKEYNKSRAVTLKNLIKRHGEEEGKKMWDRYCKRQSETKSWEYMVRTFGEEKAKSINKAKSQTLEALIKRYGEEEGMNRYMEKINKISPYYSEISQMFFNKLDKFLSPKYKTYYATKNREFGVNLKDRYVFLDYFIDELNLCIEFNGTNFHADPRIYKKDDHPNPFDLNITAQEIWDNDKDRIKKLKKLRNIDTVVVWEIDYNNGIDIKDFIENTLKINLED